jgi:Domain of unknown function (DUF4304)
MMRDEVGPALRRLGMQGTRNEFQLPSATHWALVAFQGSDANTKGSAKYTINLSVVRKAVWDGERTRFTFLPAKPRASIIYGQFHWHERIGRLMPGGEDIWWVVKAWQGTEEIAVEMVTAIRDYGLPAMRREMSA